MSFNVNPNREFTVAILPDTQYYSRNNPDIFEGQTQWIVDNQDAYNIQMVLHEGDLVQGYSSATAEWDAAEAAMDTLDNNNVPALVVPGNHDSDENDQRSIPEFRSRFPTSRYSDIEAADDTIVGYGTYEGHPENAYLLQDILDEQFLFLALELAPRSEVLDWANDVVSDYSDRTVIVVTHAYLTGSGEKSDADNSGTDVYFDSDEDFSYGIDIWNDFISQHDNIVHVTGGHYKNQDDVENGAAQNNDWTDERTWITQAFVNYQWRSNGGNGWFRLITIDVVDDLARVHTYSPHLDEWSDADNEKFEVDLWRTPIESYTHNGSLATGPVSADGGLIQLSSNSDWTSATTQENIIVENGNVSIDLSPADNEIDYFGHNDLSEFYHGFDDESITSVSSVNSTQSSNVYEGDYAFRSEAGSVTNDGIVSWPSDGLPQYPVKGYTTSLRAYFHSGDGGLRLHFAVPEGESPRTNSYYANINPSADEISAAEINNGEFSDAPNSSASIPLEEWLEVSLDWGDGITVRLNDSDGFEIASVSMTPTSSRSEGGFGIATGYDDTSPIDIDHIHIGDKL